MDDTYVPGDDFSEDDDGDEAADALFKNLDELIDRLGPAAVLHEVASYLYGLDRPYHRVGLKIEELADRVWRTAGAVDEARQTRGLPR